MKKIYYLFILTLFSSAIHAQSGADAGHLMYMGRYASAEAAYHLALRQNSNNAGAWAGLTEAYLHEGKLQQAEDSLKLAPDGVKNDPYYAVAYGAILLNKGDKAGARSYFDHAVAATKGKNTGLLAAIAEAHITAPLGDGNEAAALLQKAIKRDKHNAALYTDLGDAYMKVYNGSAAYTAYQDAIKQNDHYAPAHYKLGLLFVTQKNADLYVESFNKALMEDPDYAPALYRLYVYEFARDPAKALQYYHAYYAHADASLQNEYDLADILYLNKQYDTAIAKARSLIDQEGTSIKPRMYKLVAYSYAGKRDTAQALNYIQQYFSHEADSNLISKDYEAMSAFYGAMPGQDSLSALYLARAATIEKDPSQLFADYQKLANMAGERKDFAEQAKWLGLYYTGNERASNQDLFNWGLANYRAEQFSMADSVFGMYVGKYPEQSFGYYWQAKSKALQDRDMAKGTAVPAYQALIANLEQNPSDPNYRSWMTQAYQYLAAYEANTEKDYGAAVGYFQKVLEIDPDNENATKYLNVLQKSLAEQDGK